MAVAFDKRRLLDSVEKKDGNITEPPDDAKQGTEDAPGEDPASMVAAHGAAQEIHMKFSEAGTHVTTTHADGHTSESNHLDKERGFTHARQTTGLDEQPPDMTEVQRSRAHPTGPKEEQRQKKENSGMKHGHSTQDGSIPGYDKE